LVPARTLSFRAVSFDEALSMKIFFSFPPLSSRRGRFFSSPFETVFPSAPSPERLRLCPHGPCRRQFFRFELQSDLSAIFLANPFCFSLFPPIFHFQDIALAVIHVYWPRSRFLSSHRWIQGSFDFPGQKLFPLFFNGFNLACAPVCQLDPPLYSLPPPINAGLTPLLMDRKVAEHPSYSQTREITLASSSLFRRSLGGCPSPYPFKRPLCGEILSLTFFPRLIFFFSLVPG